MINLTLGELVNAAPALARLGAERLPIKVAYAISKIINKSQHDSEHFHEQYNAWVKELGAPDKEFGFRVKPEYMDEFERRTKELRSIAVLLDVSPVSFKLLDGTTIGAFDIIALTPFLTDLPDADAD